MMQNDNKETQNDLKEMVVEGVGECDVELDTCVAQWKDPSHFWWKPEVNGVELGHNYWAPKLITGDSRETKSF